MKRNLIHLIVLFSALGVARADVFYTNEAAWTAAVSGVTTINFEGIVPANGYQAYPGSTTIGGVTFGLGPASPNGLLFLIGDTFYGFGVATLSSQDPGTGTNPANDFLITLPNSVTALGFNYIVDPGTVTVTLSDGGTQNIVAPDTPTMAFFGVTAPGGITSVDISEPFSPAAESINLSDFEYATAGATPEPSSPWVLGSACFAAMVWFTRRRRTA